MDKTPAFSNLSTLLEENPATGPLWSDACEDLNCTFVAWNPGQSVPAHVNVEVDVVMTVISGVGELIVDGQTMPLSAGFSVVIPKGSERTISAGSDRLAYLNVHKRRRLNLSDAASRPR
ncbi:MAG: cupin domain-containing protein [Fimbriimonadaceae bacterium]|nr:cupin domain-containing protein [Fimbriimonadaceae bacterium]